MAYNGRQDRYQQTQYPPAPQNYSAHDQYDYNQQPTPYNGYQENNGEEYGRYQRDAFDRGQQYDRNYDSAQRQGQHHQQPYANVNGHAAYYDEQQGQRLDQRQEYNYDARYQSSGHPEEQYEELQPPPKGRHSPQSRPGTSASSRRIKRMWKY